MKTWIMTGIAAVGLLWVNGCIIIGNNVQPDKFCQYKDADKVAAGYVIEYIAPEAGRVTLVDKKSGKTLGTKSLSEGELFDVGSDFREENFEKFKEFGVDLKKAEFVLYFYPDVPKPLVEPVQPAQ